MRWIVVIALVAAATVAIHYEVKVRLHAGMTTGSVRTLGRLSVGDDAPEFSLAWRVRLGATRAAFARP